jgi:uncharacterized protein YdbL (DUF1318 family)
LIGLCALIALSFAAVSAQALDLRSAKAQGLVGEQIDGYLGIVNPPGTTELQQFVADINLQRREIYQQRAAAMSPPVSLEQYEAIAGEAAIKNAKPGDYVQGTNGWVRK